jgi:hypothetical protein
VPKRQPRQPKTPPVFYDVPTHVRPQPVQPQPVDDGAAVLASFAILDAKDIHKEKMAARRLSRKAATIARNEAKSALKILLKKITADCEDVDIPASDEAIAAKWTALRNWQNENGTIGQIYAAAFRVKDVGNNNHKLHRVLHDVVCSICAKTFQATNETADTCRTGGCRMQKKRNNDKLALQDGIAKLQVLIGDEITQANRQELTAIAKLDALAREEKMAAKAAKALATREKAAKALQERMAKAKATREKAARERTAKAKASAKAKPFAGRRVKAKLKAYKAKVKAKAKGTRA